MVSENTTISHQVPCSLRYPPTGLVLTRSSSTINRLLNIVNIRIILIDSPHLTTLGTPLFSKRTLHIVDNVLINYTSPSYVLPIFHRVSSYENTLCKMSFGNSLLDHFNPVKMENLKKDSDYQDALFREANDL